MSSEVNIQQPTIKDIISLSLEERLRIISGPEEISKPFKELLGSRYRRHIGILSKEALKNSDMPRVIEVLRMKTKDGGTQHINYKLLDNDFDVVTLKSNGEQTLRKLTNNNDTMWFGLAEIIFLSVVLEMKKTEKAQESKNPNLIPAPANALPTTTT